MRWFWIDRFTEFVSGDRATAIKNVSLAEEHLHDHFPGMPIMPNTLILEGLAQTGGLLVSEYNDFAERVILAKISKSRFHRYARPGDTLTYRVVIEWIRKDGAMVAATSFMGEKLQAEAEIFFAHLSERESGKPLFDTHRLLEWLRTLGIFDIGVKPDGSKIPVPEYMVDAERIALGEDEAKKINI